MTAPIRSMVDLVAAARSAQIQRGVSDLMLEHLAGLASGSVAKYLAPNPSKKLGPISTFPLLGALGKCLAVVDDPEMVATMAKRWTQRHVRGGAALQMRALKDEACASMPKPEETQRTLEQMTKQEKLKMWGQMGGKASAKKRMKTMKKRARQRSAQHAARARWAKK